MESMSMMMSGSAVLCLLLSAAGVMYMDRQDSGLKSRIMGALGTSSAKGHHILVTNDDGIGSRGLEVLARTLGKQHKVTVVAPSTNRSGTGMKSSAKPDAKPGKTVSGDSAYVSPGYPADCVLWALKNLQPPPTIVVSGINSGLNPGDPSCGSGTIGAVRTGLKHNIPGIAVSQDNFNRGGAPDATFKVAVTAVMKALGDVIGKQKKFVNINVHDGKAVLNEPVPSCPSKWTTVE